MRVTAVIAVLFALLACSPAWAQQSAEDILKASGVKGGLIVQIGCGDGKLTAALRTSDSFVVQGLDTDAANVEKARKHIQSLGLGGKVSAGVFDGQHLPYVDELANLIVIQDAGFGIRDEEIVRVLAPGGVALALDSRLSTLDSFRKPWPDCLDDWTHYLYDSEGTSVSNDRLAGPPKGMRWTGGPFWARSH